VDSTVHGTCAPLAAWLAVLAVLFVVVIDDSGLGLFKVLWDHVPGFEAIRAPFRVQLLLYPLAIYVVLRRLELALSEWSRRSPAAGRQRLTRQRVGAILGSTLALVLFVEMHRPAEFWWKPDELLDVSLRAHTDEIQARCDSLIVTDMPLAPDQGGIKTRVGPPYLRATNAVVLSMLTGVPTPQGYSRGTPNGHPGIEGDAETLIHWLRAQGFAGRICTVSSTGVRLEP
jgi:hypothetical protein